MKIIAIIPARMGSSRFPGKPMAKILDKPMIEHVYERVVKCDLLTKTVVATCDQEILDHIESIGGEAIMTGNHHERASDRCAEALGYIEKQDRIEYDIIVMVQGDEPMTHPDMIAEAVIPMLNDPKILVSNLLGDIETAEEFEDRNCIKVVCDQQSNAIYFSREPIPSPWKGWIELPRYMQTGIIAFRRDTLIEFNAMKETQLEQIESVDMNRVLEAGGKIRMVLTEAITIGVDVLEELLEVEKILIGDEIVKGYL